VTIRDHFANLLTFSGRETRAEFWPWAGVVLAIGFLGMAIAMLPTLFEALGRMQRFAAEHPDQATVSSGPGSYSIAIEGSHPELMPDLEPALLGLGIVLLLMIVLLAAAVTRRLHDTGRGGGWGLLPLPFIVIALLILPGLFSGPEFPIGLFSLLFANNFVYLLTLGLVIVLLSLPSRNEAASAHDR